MYLIRCLHFQGQEVTEELSHLVLATSRVSFQGQEVTEELSHLVLATSRVPFQGQEVTEELSHLVLATSKVSFQDQEVTEELSHLVLATSQVSFQGQEVTEELSYLVLATSRVSTISGQHSSTFGLTLQAYMLLVGVHVGVCNISLGLIRFKAGKIVEGHKTEVTEQLYHPLAEAVIRSVNLVVRKQTDLG